MLALQFVIHRTLVFINLLLFNPAGLLSFFLSNPIYTVGLATPLLVGPAAAAGGLAGLAGLAAVPAQAVIPPVPMPVATIPVTEASPLPAVSAAPIISPAPLHVSAPVSAPASITATAAAGPPTPPPTFVGPEGAMTAQNFVSPYLVGVLGEGTESRVAGKSLKPASHATTAAAAAAAPAAIKPEARRRRQQAPRRTDRGYRYEFLDPPSDAELKSVAASNTAGQANSTTASSQGARPAGLAATTVARQQAAGLTRLAGDAFGGAPTIPMMPSTIRFRLTGAGVFERVR